MAVVVSLLACCGVLASSCVQAWAAGTHITVVTEGASNVQPSSARLNGTLTTKPPTAATYHFDYGTTMAYGQSTAAVEVPAATGAIPATSAVSGLTPNAVYHFRLVVVTTKETNKGPKAVETLGGDASFTTPGPPHISATPGEGLSHTEEVVKARINPDKLATKYHFEYGESAAYGTPTPEGEVPAGEAFVPVSATLKGLKLGTTYHFRVVAENAAGTTFGPDEEFTSLLIDSVSATKVGADSATLNALINPAGVPTTYRFEFGESTSYGTSTPAPDGNLGAAVGDQSVSARIEHLRPGTTYHYRVVASAEDQSAASSDRTFTTLGAALPDGRSYELVSPPQKHGAYILGISNVGGAIQAAADGSALAYVVDGTITEDPEGNRSPLPQAVLSTRTAAGWASQELVTPQERTFGTVSKYAEYRLFSPDLSLGLLQPNNTAQTPLAEPPLSPPLSEAERGHQEKSIYLRENAPIVPGPAQASSYEHAKQDGELLAAERGEATAAPGYLPLVTAANVLPGTKFGGVQTGAHLVGNQMNVQTATPDLSHVVLFSSAGLVEPLPSSGEGQLYEWSADGSPSGGSLQLVSVLPSGAPEEAAPPELGYGRTAILPKFGSNFRHAISDDGSRVIWTSEEAAEQSFGGLGHLYLRDTARQETVQLDLPEGPPNGEPGKALFQTASSDGSKVFFTDSQRLTADSSAAPEETVEGKHVPPRRDLYECDVVEVPGTGKLGCTLSDLTADQNPGEAAAVQGLILGAAEDGTNVYFVADGVLAPGAAPGACRSFNFGAPPPAGTTCNLYVAQHESTGWTTRFIARLSSEDAPDFIDPNKSIQFLINKPVRVSPNGRYLAFMSNRSLTGYDNTDVNESEVHSGEGTRHADEEVFLYDSDSAALRCASCDPSGARPRGVYDTQFAGEGEGLLVDGAKTWIDGFPGIAHWLAGNIPGWTPLQEFDGISQSRYLSDSGRLFFNSADALVPAAAGATRQETLAGKPAAVGVENVYQYEPNAVGSCMQADGCVALLSGGSSRKEAAFLEASASGGDVFFLTDTQLLPQDVDAERDVYDARVCGEAGCVAPGQPASEGCADATSCKGGSAPVPSFQAPPSTTLSGAGNLLGIAPQSETLAEKKVLPPLTRKQKLARALKQCHKLAHRTRAQKQRRAKCEALARHRYGTRKAKHPAKHHKGKGR